MIVIGITGGIGAGKSLVTKILKEKYGAGTIETDIVAHEVMKKGSPVYTEIIRHFGITITDEDGEIDRKELSAKVFEDKELLALLNSIVHPAVEEEVDRRIRLFRGKGFPYVTVETALLIEAGYRKKCDEVWYVHADSFVRVERLKKNRGMNEEKALRIIKSQQTEEAYRGVSDRVIENSSDEESLREEIDRNLRMLKGGKDGSAIY